MKYVSIVQMKVHFSDWIRMAEGGKTVVVTRHSRPVAALVSVRDLELLERFHAAGPDLGLAGLAKPGGAWEDAEDLVAAVEAVRRGPSRPIPDLE